MSRLLTDELLREGQRPLLRRGRRRFSVDPQILLLQPTIVIRQGLARLPPEQLILWNVVVAAATERSAAIQERIDEIAANDLFGHTCHDATSWMQIGAGDTVERTFEPPL